MKDDALEKKIDDTVDRLYAEIKLVEERRIKLTALREAGNAFPNDFRRDDLAQDLHREYGDYSNEKLEEAPPTASVAGRMILKRVMGKASFATIKDMSGRIQLYIATDVAGAETQAAFKHYDLGDILGAEGTLFRTRTGELSVRKVLTAKIIGESVTGLT